MKYRSHISRAAGGTEHNDILSFNRLLFYAVRVPAETEQSFRYDRLMGRLDDPFSSIILLLYSVAKSLKLKVQGGIETKWI